MLTMMNSADDFKKTECTIAVLPVGAVEQHGPHLPVGTDTLMAHALATEIANHLSAYLMPAIPITSSIEHRLTKGTVYIESDTLSLLLRDIAKSLRFSGFEKLVIINCHSGNWGIKPTVRQLNRDLSPFRVMLLPVEAAMRRNHEIFTHTDQDIHAGEFETSLMLHLYPEAVGPIHATKESFETPQAFLDYFDMTEITKEGYWGFPQAATAEKGKQAIDSMVKCLLSYFEKMDQTWDSIVANRGGSS